jgi:predicted dehydrogenase
MQRLNVAIVGTGNVAQNNYMPCLAKDPDVSFAYCNRTREKAETCASRFGGHVFGSLAELMGWKPDAVFVLTREKDRFEAASALMEFSPRRLFFEKPLVARNGFENVTEQDFFDGRAIICKAQEIGCQTAMIFNYRFFDHSIMAKRLVAERDFGRVLNFTGLAHFACWCHCIDLVHFFAGPVAEVSALQGQTVHNMAEMQATDVTAGIRTQDDATGTLVGSFAPAWDLPLFELTFNFERGRIRLQDLDGDLEVMDARDKEVERFSIARGLSRWDQYASSFGKSIKAYLDSVRNGQAPPVPGLFGLLELQVEAGLKRSIAQSRPIVLADEFPLELK